MIRWTPPTGRRPKLSILVCALQSRAAQSENLLRELEHQCRVLGDVEILVAEDNGERPSGAKRNDLIRNSTGEYFCFVDDDDFVAPYYAKAIRDAADGQVDVVTFDMLRVDIEGGGGRIHSFSIHNQDRERISSGYWKMTANHLCAWRRDVGTKVAFPDNLGYADDVFWYRPLIDSGLVKIERHLDLVLYFYLWGGGATSNQSRDSIKATRQWQGGGIECFRRRGEIFLANKPLEKSEGEAAVECRNKFGHVVVIPRKDLIRTGIVRT